MKKLRSILNKKTLKKFIFPLIIVLIWVLVVLTNYTPNTYLTGWDNEHFEFDILLNFERLINSVWAEYQGLGAVGAHSHASDLPRLLIVAITSIFVPLNLVRYVYIFGTLLVGSLGVYYLLKNIISIEYKTKGKEVVSLAAALFFMLNITTVQQFIVPFEMFSTQFAFLPWIILVVIKLLKNFSYKKLLILLILNIFAAPMAYASMLWIAYFGSLTIFLIIFAILHRKKSVFKRILAILGVTIISNLFWILPTAYFVLNHSDSVPEAKTNINFSEEAFLINQKYGNLEDVILLKGFLFDWNIRNNAGQYVPLLDGWIEHTESPPFIFISLAIFGISLIGILLSLFHKKKITIAFVAFFAIGLIMLLGMNSPIGQILFSIIGQSGALSEALRFPYTKFSIIFIFGISIFFGIGLLFAMRFIHRVVRLDISPILISFFLLGFFIIYSYPAFSGNFIHKNLQVKIPDEYFEVFKFFKTQDQNTRIANLPINSLYGWYYTDWGYQGSGFLWYGIKQPILDRDFDRWYDPLEDYYDEMSNAIYSENIDELRYVLDKYSIDWILIDRNVISLRDPTQTGSTTYDTELKFIKTKEMLEQIENIALAETFGDIEIYSVTNNTKSFITNTVYPIDYNLRLFPETNTERKNNLSTVTKEDNTIKLSKSLSFDNELIPFSITIPAFAKAEEFINTNIYAKKEDSKVILRFEYIIPELKIEGITYPRKENLFEEFIFQLPENKRRVDYLSLNNNIFNFRSVDSDFSLIGQAELNTNSTNIINLFERESVNNKLNLERLKLTNCIDETIPNGSLNIIDNNSIQFESVGTICAEYTQPFSLDNRDLLILNAEYSTPFAVKPNVCIYQEEGCLEIEIINTLTKNIRAHFISTSEIDTQLSISFDNPNDNKVRDLKYTNLNYSIYKNIFSDSIKIENSELFDDISIEITNTQLNVDFSFYINEVDKIQDNNLIHLFNSSIQSCDLKSNRFQEKLLGVDREFSNIIIENTNSSSCINLDLQTPLRSNSGYLIYITGQNIEGAPISLSVINNTTRKALIENRLFRNKNNKLFFVSNSKEDYSTLSVFLLNQSFVEKPTKNRIESIVLSKIPSNWLNQIEFIIDENNQYLANLNVNKYGNFIYRVDGLEYEYLSLKQSFEKGWIAIDSNLQILEKIKNNTNFKIWDNKWRINDTNRSVFIIFLPQILEFIGLVAIVCSSIVLIKQSKNEKN